MNIVRFAPSPTGFVHIGSLRTALYNYLFAKKTNGKYILRVEDTDQTRFVEGAIEGMLNSMNWANVNHSEGVMMDKDGNIYQCGENGPYIQSERLDIYKKYIDILEEKGIAYRCFCTKDRLDAVRDEQKSKGENFKYDGCCKCLSEKDIEENLKNNVPYVYRMKLPKNTNITFKDVVRGEVTVNTDDMDDQVLMKSDGFPTYHFAVIIDDHLMGVTHIIRGEEWLPSTPKHIFLYNAFGWDIPTYVHLPNILNSDKKKLSKRQGDVAVEDFKNKGYLPEALVNYIALLGWSPDNNSEFFTMEELEKNFSLEKVSKSGGVFDILKLNWMNNQYIKNYDLDKLVELCIPYLIKSGTVSEEFAQNNKTWLKLAVETVRESIDFLSIIPEKIKPFLSEYPKVLEEDVLEFFKNEHMRTLYDALKEKIVNINNNFTPEEMAAVFKEIQQEYSIKGKNLFMGSRVILTGQMHGSDINKSLSLIGKDNLIKRMEESNKYL